jgi:Skp family chaperone for outer membrane proteins
MTKALFGGALVALALATPAISAAQQTPAAAIVIVDRQRIAAECNACKAASATLQGMINSAQQRQQTLSGPLQGELQSIQQADAAAQKMPAGAARAAAEKQVQARFSAFQQKNATANQELQRLDQQIQSTNANVTQQILDKVDPIVVSVMRAHSASIAIDKSVTIASTPSLDVTNEVLAQFNSSVTSLSVTPLPQATQQPAATPGR